MLQKEDLRTFAQIPLKQVDNRVWRTYHGGAMIDQWKGITPASDSSFPEEWIMSTITARGRDRPPMEGLSLVETPAGLISLRDLIASDPPLFLGEKLANKYGTTGVLIKMLDSQERLTIQVHPDKTYAKEVLHSEFGKTESWFVLGCRNTPEEKAAVYMGFREGVNAQQWRALFQRQDIEGMLACLHKIEVEPGDAFMVYGGVPHAIGAGCFLLEVQEPTDYTMRTEKTTPAGLKIENALIHQGVGEEKMLECFHYDPCSLAEALDRWKIKPQIIDNTMYATLRSIFNTNHTTCFGVSELSLAGAYTLRGQDHCFVGVIYSGRGTMICNEIAYDFEQGDEIFFSAAIDHVVFKSETPVRILLCYPPNSVSNL